MGNKSVFYYFGLLGQLGLTIMISILISVGLYKLVERFIGQNGFVFILFILMGIVAGFVAVYKLISNISDK